MTLSTGLEQDLWQAEAWWRVAASAGNSNAMVHLAFMHEKGEVSVSTGINGYKPRGSATQHAHVYQSIGMFDAGGDLKERRGSFDAA